MRILLLSDIHFMSLADEVDKYYVERCAFLDDLRDCHEALGEFSHVLVCGDIANHGTKEEYDKAFDFFAQISEIIDCPIEQFYVVPGNHDKNWGKEAKCSNLMHSGLSNEAVDSQHIFYKLLEDDFQAVKSLYAPFELYNDFALKMNCLEPLMSKCLDDNNLDGYDINHDKAFVKELLSDIDGYKVCLYGFNTAIASDANEITDRGIGHKLFLPALSYNVATDKKCINICMMHHPLEMIASGDEISQILDRKFPIQIYGHLHKPDVKNGSALHIMSGAFQPPEDGTDGESEYLPTYHIIELGITHHANATSDSLQVKIWVERYHDGEFEHDGNKQKPVIHEIALPKGIKRWTHEQMEHNQPRLPSGITERRIQFEFLHCRKQAQIIRELGNYDSKKSLSQNIIIFLNMISRENKLVELWETINNTNNA